MPNLSNKFHQTFLDDDPFLNPYEEIINRRLKKIVTTEKKLTQDKISLIDFASGHEYYGLHLIEDEWVFREWAPNASDIYLTGDFTGWEENKEFRLKKLDEFGDWGIRLPFKSINNKDLFRLKMHWPGGVGDRIPAYARRVVQDPETHIFNAQVWNNVPYKWLCNDFQASGKALFIYEAHIGMAQEEGRVGTYSEFTNFVLPKIIKSGYNALQLMAIPEHPYYGSFGYHVSSFFAASSRFGSPEELKRLIDTAHSNGIMVIMDIVHSHAVRNEIEGLSCFDGTTHQYFHEGSRGDHDAWDSRCFDYKKPQVLHFLLSNCKFWLDEYRFDGFRFDGVTSMLYHNHGLGKAFTSYDQYFDDSVDNDAYTYLTLANKLIHELRPDAITIAEDISGMPGLAAPLSKCGVGFNFRLAMGVPDFWIKLIKEVSDDRWPVGHLWYELTNRRTDENTISYAESHDQALVGDKTLIFRLIDAGMYNHMHVNDQNIMVDRGMSLHKLIRLITMTTAGKGYMNFMGNEFGHPEWIDFPREGNNWSYHYARRQWYLADDPVLKYRFLLSFDRAMIKLAREYSLLDQPGINLVYEHYDNKIIAFERSGLLFVFNFHPATSYTDYLFQTRPGKYKLIFNSDAKEFGGHGRLIKNQLYFTLTDISDMKKKECISIYIPTRTAMILRYED